MRRAVMGVLGALTLMGTTALAQAPATGGDAKTEAAATAAAPKPSPEAIRAFWEYYFNGKGGGPVLADAKLCQEIGKEADKKNECVKEAPAEGVKPGTTLMVWQAYLLPQGETTEDLTLQVKLGDTVRETKDLKLKGESIRTRTWTSVRLPKAGDWSIVIARGNDVLKTLTVKVK